MAKENAQRYGIDHDKTTALTTSLDSFRMILHIAAALEQQFDIKTAFLHGVLPEDEAREMACGPVV